MFIPSQITNLIIEDPVTGAIVGLLDQTGFSLPDSMTRATRIIADDSFVYDMVVMARKLSNDNHRASRDILEPQE
jgi:hypothetical protein